MKERQYVSDNPELLAEWDFIRNASILPSQLSIGSNQRVWWHGSCGHNWDAIVKERSRGYGCPICAGKRVVEGINDLQSQSPELASQWDCEKNAPVLPNMITKRSGKRFWWLCDQGHSYIATVSDRVGGSGCPYCKGKRTLSGTNDLASQNPTLAKEYSPNNPVGAEAIMLHSHKKVRWICSRCKHEWEASVDSRNRGNGCPACAARTQSSFPEQAVFYYIQAKHPDAINRYTSIELGRMELDIYIPSLAIGVEYDGKHWHTGSISSKREQAKYEICKSMGITLIRMRHYDSSAPSIADYTVNLTTDLDTDISQLSRWNLVGEDIDTQRDRLTIIANYLHAMRSHSFATKHPKLAEEWCYERNEGLSPNMFSEFCTQARFWWQCSKGHVWQCTIASRTNMRTNCPYCSNRKLLKGYNDFLTTNQNPQLLDEWDYTLNAEEGIFPDGLTEGSKKRVWWRCRNGHVWKAMIAGRKRGDSCPVCSNRKIQVGYNDLATIHSQLALEWDYEKNKPLLPTMVSTGSDRKVWWKCKEGHEWPAPVRRRSQGIGCPYCAGKHTVVGKNDLGTTHPHLLEEWDYQKNMPLSPTECSFGSNKRVWWICKTCGHKWRSIIQDRTRGHGCPACARNRHKS